MGMVLSELALNKEKTVELVSDLNKIKNNNGEYATQAKELLIKLGEE